jgi:hypothetical protein
MCVVLLVQLQGVRQQVLRTRTKHAEAMQEPADEPRGQGTAAESHEVDLGSGLVMVHDEHVRLRDDVEQTVPGE